MCFYACVDCLVIRTFNIDFVVRLYIYAAGSPWKMRGTAKTQAINVKQKVITTSYAIREGI